MYEASDGEAQKICLTQGASLLRVIDTFLYRHFAQTLLLQKMPIASIFITNDSEALVPIA
jgi:hypothetical protein